MKSYYVVFAVPAWGDPERGTIQSVHKNAILAQRRVFRDKTASTSFTRLASRTRPEIGANLSEYAEVCHEG